MAQADFFLKIAGIEGESEDKKNPKEFEVQSWSFGVSNQGSMGVGGGGAVGKASFQDFHFTIVNNKSSAVLMGKVATGAHIAEATLTCRKSTGAGGQVPYLIVKFHDIVVSSYQVGGSQGGSLPMEQISFNYTKMQMITKVQDSKGVITDAGDFTYNLKENAKG
jgi:type VI secretion system secreted protein Hcp